jgi:hypothetical protein
MSRSRFFALVLAAGCGSSGSTSSDGAVDFATSVDLASSVDLAGANACALTDDTTATTTVNGGCALLTRDTSSCRAARTAGGLSGAWLEFSCRVALSASANVVQMTSDSRPDYRSNYFPTTDPCYQAYTTAFPDPNLIVAENVVVEVPLSPGGAGRTMGGLGVVGLALNGVSIFSNQAAPGDDIYTEVGSFDQCQGHPNNTAYHYHTEPYSISYDDSALVGVMRDGYFIYGRKDLDGSAPTLDADGGHSGTTPDSATPVYHYHVNQQTSSGAHTAGQTAWFLTTGTLKASPGACSGCGDM